jgi:ATP-dependent Lhr-like helicase
MNERMATESIWQDFHPAVAAWFGASFPSATEAQRRAWPLIQAGRPTLVAAPTGSGKTLTAARHRCRMKRRSCTCRH